MSGEKRKLIIFFCMIYEPHSFRVVIISRVQGGDERPYFRIPLRLDNYIKLATMSQVFLPISIAFVILFHEMKMINNYYRKSLSWMSRINMLNLRLIKSRVFSLYFRSISSESRCSQLGCFFFIVPYSIHCYVFCFFCLFVCLSFYFQAFVL